MTKIAASSVEGPLLVKVGSFDPTHLGMPELRGFTVPDLEEASSVCRAFIEEENLGASTWAGGEVISEETGLCVAVVSYNGRVWFPKARSPEGLALGGDLEYDLSV